MSISDITDEVPLKNSFGRSPQRVLSAGMPDKRTPKQVVDELGLTKGMSILMNDGVTRLIYKITSNGDVFVRGMRGKINIYALKKG